ncbi:LptF/LptG family permease [Niabella hibiscisoli]|uniref:LptF/LptG family permease n=1 Tax=Niabella hibiscisoli TaxID=1825928 RepID=UPI001F0F72A3|nr:LptF/LptG family permease [Niabella hibiscisoli]MCH5715421.1 LptF/LptG family permease [Niabella hibiscisoli]
MKKLDKLIIKAFIGPFVATFFITLFVLIMQFFWLWIDDFVGKGLDAATILKFIWYQSAVLIPLALPLSVLLSSLMTFGNLGESFELVAIKSAGISLLRFMRPLFVVASCIALGAFLFANYVIPVANLKSRTLLADIVLAKPAFAIKEGVFLMVLTSLPSKSVKKANDSIIRDVIVYQSGDNGLQDAFLIARDGVMKPSADKRYLDIVFKNGWRYEERGSKEDSTTDYIRLGFKEYKMQMDISSFKFTKTDDSANVNNERMYNMRQLDVAIDSISKFNGEISKNFEATMYSNFMILNYRDSVTKGIKIPDSIFNFKANIDAYMGVKKDSTKAQKDSARAKVKLDSTRQKLKADSLKRVARKDSIRFKKIADSTRRKARRDSLKMGLRPLSPPPQRNISKDSLKNKKPDTSARSATTAKDTAKNKKDTSSHKKIA